MARKSRKQIAVEEPVVESVSSEVFSTAIYARLSVENSGKSEKVDVIANQIEICKSYIAERPYLIQDADLRPLQPRAFPEGQKRQAAARGKGPVSQSFRAIRLQEGSTGQESSATGPGCGSGCAAHLPPCGRKTRAQRDRGASERRWYSVSHAVQAGKQLLS